VLERLEIHSPNLIVQKPGKKELSIRSIKLSFVKLLSYAQP
jgi:hypothetical protein